MSTKLIVMSDLHVGSTVGLCPPYVELDDGGSYRSNSKVQRWLWQCWKKANEKIDEALSTGDPMWLVFNGDLIDGNHHGTHQVWTKSEEKQAETAIAIIDPLIQKAERVFVLRGTWSHVGQSAQYEERIAYDIDAEKDTETGNHSWSFLPLTCEGVNFDFAHFGKLGYRRWTRPNAMNVLAAETILDYSERRERCPDVVVRSHRHQYADSFTNYAVRVIQTPAWQLASGWVGSYQPGTLADIGFLIFDCNDGSYNLDAVRFPPQRRHRWKAPRGQ